MSISVFDLFKIGIGPSSSHTVGPMRAGLQFVSDLDGRGKLDQIKRIRVDLFGSLSATGVGHGTDRAVVLGLMGESPDTVDPASVEPRLAASRDSQQLSLLGKHSIAFVEKEDVVFHRGESLPYHPNGMRMTAVDETGDPVYSKTYYSIGGGFVVDEETAQAGEVETQSVDLPYHFDSAQELLELCQKHQLSVSQLMMENEKYWRPEPEIRAGILGIWEVMRECVQNGIRHEGYLPGGLNVKRRAPGLYRKLEAGGNDNIIASTLNAMDWVNLYALAVNEENAAGGRVVTAPTNGAAGIVPAVLHYYTNFCEDLSHDGVIRFMLAASAVGILCKRNASISGAEVGCQGEVGSACAMAAAGLTEVLGGSPPQVENAAEIAMEHNLGLTCDPVAGLVQVPCIERNAMAAMKAINATQMALRGDGSHFVSLDKVIKTMRDTGFDMQEKYKETSLGGLAVNVIEC
ncbi:L-serine ammonia-lyase [Microbulbifer sp.]|uniref:L-serine ammonia-lyase n=1 Tax=Microbulbifer sp. TaxID=1908541 RepID=UPI003F37DC1C